MSITAKTKLKQWKYCVEKNDFQHKDEKGTQMIKTIIFDFDDTLYTGAVWTDWCDYMKDIFQAMGGKREEYAQMMEKHGFDSKNAKKKDLAEVAKVEDLSLEKFREFLDKNIYKHSTEDVKVIDNEFLKALSKVYHLYILTMSPQNYLHFYMKKYGIDESSFKGLYSVDLLEKDDTKLPEMKLIMQKENCKASEILMVGDSFTSDIQPAQELGFSVLHFDGNYNHLYDYFTKHHILNCERFKK